MKSVHKGTRLEFSVAFDALRAAALELNAEREAIAAELEGLAERVNAKVGAYNEAVRDFNEKVDEVVEVIDEYVADRSDRWREGEKGQAYDAWRQAVEEARLDEVDEVDDLELEGEDAVPPEDLPPLALDDVGA